MLTSRATPEQGPNFEKERNNNESQRFLPRIKNVLASVTEIKDADYSAISYKRRSEKNPHATGNAYKVHVK